MDQVQIPKYNGKMDNINNVIELANALIGLENERHCYWLNIFNQLANVSNIDRASFNCVYNLMDTVIVHDKNIGELMNNIVNKTVFKKARQPRKKRTKTTVKVESVIKEDVFLFPNTILEQAMNETFIENENVGEDTVH